jgi:serine/threonine-protein kinase RsbT
VREHVDAYAARRAVRTLGKQLGFSRTGSQELEIVVSELCSNIVKYGVRGSLQLSRCADATGRAGLEIVAHDVGPPFHDLELALQDGYDDRGPIDPGTLLTRRGLGTGLGAVLRLSDSLEVLPEPGGKRIVVRRFLVRPTISKR